MPEPLPNQVKRTQVVTDSLQVTVSTVRLPDGDYDTAIVDDSPDGRYRGWLVDDFVIGSSSKRVGSLAEAELLHAAAVAACYVMEPEPPAEVRAAAEPGPLTADEGLSAESEQRLHMLARMDRPPLMDVKYGLAAAPDEVERLRRAYIFDTAELKRERDGLQRFADSYAPNVADQEAKRVALETELAELKRRGVDDLLAKNEEIQRLRAELDSYERLTEQSCPKGEHPVWLVDSENHHACPWCQIKALEAVKGDLEDRLTARLADLAARPSRAETLSEAENAVEDRACDADYTDSPDFCAGLRAAVELISQLREGGEGPARSAPSLAEQAERHSAAMRWPGPDAVVAYRHPHRDGLYCRIHGHGRPHLIPLAADDLPYGGTCTWGVDDDVCGRDVLIDPTGGAS